MRGGAGLALWFCVILPTTAPALDCGESANETEMNICAAKAYHAADARLKAQYGKIIVCLKGGAKSLVDAQRAWRDFRDAECKFQGSASEGGSLQPFVVEECLAAVTHARVKALDYYLTCREGDASCPTWHCKFE